MDRLNWYIAKYKTHLSEGSERWVKFRFFEFGGSIASLFEKATNSILSALAKYLRSDLLLAGWMCLTTRKRQL
jgi:hypothetical protein